MQDTKLQAILDAKEKRAAMQLKIIKKYNAPLVSFTLNIPGPEKNSNMFNKVHNIGSLLLEEKLKRLNLLINYKVYNEAAGGYEGFFCINGDAFLIKRITIDIEETHPLGRIFDFDVFNIDGKLISRKDLNLKERRCMLCHESALVCRRNRNHTLKELLEEIQKNINSYYDCI